MNWQLSVLEQRDTSALRVAEWIKPSLFLEKQVIPTFINANVLQIKLSYNKKKDKRSFFDKRSFKNQMRREYFSQINPFKMICQNCFIAKLNEDHEILDSC